MSCHFTEAVELEEGAVHLAIDHGFVANDVGEVIIGG